MTLTLVPTHVTDSGGAIVRAAPVPGPRCLGWSEALPEGLTDQDLTRITETIAAGRAESTRRSYAWQWDASLSGAPHAGSPRCQRPRPRSAHT